MQIQWPFFFKSGKEGNRWKSFAAKDFQMPPNFNWKSNFISNLTNTVVSWLWYKTYKKRKTILVTANWEASSAKMYPPEWEFPYSFHWQI